MMLISQEPCGHVLASLCVYLSTCMCLFIVMCTSQEDIFPRSDSLGTSSPLDPGHSFSPGYPDATLDWGKVQDVLSHFSPSLLPYPNFLIRETQIGGILPPVNLLCTNTTVKSVSMSLMYHVCGLPGAVHTKTCVRDDFNKCISQSQFNLFVLLECITKYGVYFTLTCKSFNVALFKCELLQRY